MINPMQLGEKRILITGASSGIGRACAIMAAELGASVVLTGRSESRLNETLNFISRVSSPNGHLVCSGDILSKDFIQELVSACGRLDGLVHAAGICQALPLRMVSSEDLHRIYETNVFAFMELMKVFANRRKANPSFSAVAVSSVAGLAGWDGFSAYSGSKGALNAIVRALAVELSSLGFRVNAVCPSNIQTPMLDEILQGIDRQQALDAILPRQPLGIGSPEQVAAAVCFLLSDAASFITGVNLPVDGGYMAQ